MSDNVSLASEDALTGGSSGAAFIELEDVGKFVLNEAAPGSIKRMVLVDALFGALIDDGVLLLGELRANKKDWTLHAKTTAWPPGNNVQGGGRYLDMALIRGSGGESKITLVLLGERKNKERFLAAHHITQLAKSFEIGEELSVYDKSNVLGKLTSHLAASHDLEAVFTVSNLVRKIRVEDCQLKPTTARAPIPSECQDGTLGVCVLPGGSSRKGSSASNKGNYVVLALRTKSASGKNKYAIEWYSCNKKDELSAIKGSTVKLHDDSEPVAVLSDPKDSRSIFAIYSNKAMGSSALHKMSKSSSAGPVASWDFPVSCATLGWVGESLVIAVLPDNATMSNQIRVFVVHKTDGFRSRHPGCANCRPLEDISSSAHVISCSASKWQLHASVLDGIVFAGKASVLLASLCLPDGSLALEPDSGLPYRVRIVGCPVRGLHPEAILLEDIDRIFDGDVATLSGLTLKICTGSKPCKGCYSLLASWLKTDKIASIELYYASNDHGIDDDLKESDRFTITSISHEKFRIYISDVDWTQQMKLRPQAAFMESSAGGGTFTLDTDENGKTSLPHRPMSASVCSNSSRIMSRIPTPKSASLASSMRSAPDHDEEELDLEEANQRLRALVQKMATTLSVILDVDVALRNNLINLNSTVSEIQEEMASCKMQY